MNTSKQVINDTEIQNLIQLVTFIYNLIKAKEWVSPKDYLGFKINPERKCVELKFPSPYLLRKAKEDQNFKHPFVWTKCPMNENAKTLSFFLV